MEYMRGLLDSQTDDVQAIGNLSENFSSLRERMRVWHSASRFETGFYNHADEIMDISEIFVQVDGPVFVMAQDFLAQLGECFTPETLVIVRMLREVRRKAGND